jgi:hypothetical protein
MREENGRKFKRGFFSGDYHSGHYVGLTPPKYWSDEDTKWGKTQRACWNFFSDRLNLYKPLDLVQANGDLIAGKNKKSGSKQLLRTSMEEQCEISRDVLLFCDCELIRITRGTGYHVTTDGEQWENIIARMLREGNDKLNVRVNNHGYYNFNGKNFDVKHKISGSGILWQRKLCGRRCGAYKMETHIQTFLLEVTSIIRNKYSMTGATVLYYQVCRG